MTLAGRYARGAGQMPQVICCLFFVAARAALQTKMKGLEARSRFTSSLAGYSSLMMKLHESNSPAALIAPDSRVLSC